MNSFQEIMPKVFGNLGFRKKFNGERVLLHWQDIVGKRIAEHTQPVRLRQGVLTVIANNAVWAHHLMTSKEDIIENINKFCDEKVVNDVKFKAGYLKNDQNEENTEEVFSVPDWRRAHLSSAEADRINDAVQDLSDDLLKNKVRQIITKDLAQKKAKVSADWHSCRYCEILCPPEQTICPSCSVEVNEKRNNSLRDLLTHAPWLDYEEASKYVACLQKEYNTIRNDLIDRLSQKVTQQSQDKVLITTLAMLIHRKKPQALTAENIENIFGKVRRK